MWGENYARRSRKSTRSRRLLERRFSALSRLAQERDRRRKLWEEEHKALMTTLKKKRNIRSLERLRRTNNEVY